MALDEESQLHEMSSNNSSSEFIQTLDSSPNQNEHSIEQQQTENVEEEIIPMVQPIPKEDYFSLLEKAVEQHNTSTIAEADETIAYDMSDHEELILARRKEEEESKLNEVDEEEEYVDAQESAPTISDVIEPMADSGIQNDHVEQLPAQVECKSGVPAETATSDDDNEPISRKEMLELFKQLNLSMVSRDEESKNVIVSLRTEVADLKNELIKVGNIPSQLHDHIAKTKQQFSNLNASNLILEEEIKNMKKQLFLFDSKTDTHSVKFPSSQQFDKLLNRVHILETDTKQSTIPLIPPNPTNIMFLDGDSVAQKLNKINLKLDGVVHDQRSNKADIINLAAMAKSGISPKKNQDAVNNNGDATTTDDLIIDCDLLMMFDSNGQYMDPKKMKNDSQYVRSSTIEDALYFIENSTVQRAPLKVLLNVGLNDISNDDPDPVIESYKTLVDAIRSLLPTTEIYISSILHRKDNKFTKTIDKVNGTFGDWDKVSPHVTFIHHTNIINNEKMMYDTKHLTKTGFFAMVTNFKYVMYRILPTFHSPRKGGGNRGGGGYRRYRDNRGGGGPGGGGRGGGHQ